MLLSNNFQSEIIGIDKSQRVNQERRQVKMCTHLNSDPLYEAPSCITELVMVYKISKDSSLITMTYYILLSTYPFT